jgi:hypothetical protein
MCESVTQQQGASYRQALPKISGGGGGDDDDIMKLPFLVSLGDNGLCTN